MKIITMQHILGHKILEYDVDERGVIIDEREYNKYRKYPQDDIIIWIINDTILKNSSKLKNS